MPNACFFGIPVVDTRIEAERCSVRCPSGVNEGSLQAAQCAEDSAHYNKTAAFGLVGFEPTASWSRTRRDTKLRYSPK